MARLISPPLGLGVVSVEPLSGPRTVGAGGSQSIGDFVQTVAAPFGLWRYRIGFHPMRDREFRLYRGWVTALHGGANATRWSMFDPDMPTPRETGIEVPAYIRWDTIGGQPWANGEPWSNGVGWGTTAPSVAVAAGAVRGDTIVTLADEYWGRTLIGGEDIGFFPGFFCKHRVTEVLGSGKYRIWPPLRHDLSAADFATLYPTLAMRLESEEGASGGRGLVVAEGLSITLVEVPHYQVAASFGD